MPKNPADEHEIRKSLEDGLKRAFGEWRQAQKWATEDIVLLQALKVQSVLGHLIDEMTKGGE